MRLTAIFCLTAVLSASAVPAEAQSLTFAHVAPSMARTRPIHLPRGTFLPAPPRRVPPRIPIPIPIPVPYPVVPAQPRIVQPNGNGKGALVGALVGAGVGAVLGLADPVGGLKRKDAAAVGAFLFGGLGAYVGHSFDF